jgi:urease accessory protein
MTASLLLLTDSRLPAGGHTHSGGAEQAVAAGMITDLASLAGFLLRRLATSGAVAAGLAAAACAAADERGAGGSLEEAGKGGLDSAGERHLVAVGARRATRLLSLLDDEADARTPSPALRSASRQQGRGLVRVGRRAWPSPVWDTLPGRPHHPIALGIAAAAAGLPSRDAAAAAAYLSVSGPATAAQRLLALDPLAVAALTARLAPEIDAVAGAALRSSGHICELSAATDPLLDLLAEVHVARKDRFFAS